MVGMTICSGQVSHPLKTPGCFLSFTYSLCDLYLTSLCLSFPICEMGDDNSIYLQVVGKIN